MQIINDLQLDFNDVLIKPKRTTLSSRNEADIIRNYGRKFKWYDTKGDLNLNGIMIANMATTGTIEMAKKLQKYKTSTCLHKHYTYDELDAFTHTNLSIKDTTFLSIGLKDDHEKTFKLLDSKIHCVDKICIDVANGYIPQLLELVKKIRTKYKNSILIMVGNVVTGDITQDLILSGADIVKVGIGPGSVCTTRKQTGVGRPQLSTIIDCADAAHGVGGMICADGGCTCPGDIAKAFGAGADFVMLGGMFAGTDESTGETIERMYKTHEYDYEYTEGMSTPYGILENDYSPIKPKYEIKKFKQFYGMSSQVAQDKHFGGMAKYRSSEGKSVEVPYKGSAADVMEDILGGLRSTMTYIGAKRLKDITKCCTFYRVNNQLNKVFERYEK